MSRFAKSTSSGLLLAIFHLETVARKISSSWARHCQDLLAFGWNAQYPIIPWLLKALSTHLPQCRLYTRVPAWQQTIPSLPHLCGSPCLYSLDVEFSPTDWHAFSRLRDLAISCHSLENLSVIWKSRSHAQTWYESLEHLPESLQLRSLEVDGPMELPDNGGVWNWSIKWPLLEDFSCTNITFLPSLASQLIGLRVLPLRIGLGELVSALWAFLVEQCLQLAVLDLTGCTAAINKSGEDLWGHLGKTLISLRIHEDERPRGTCCRPVLLRPQLRLIATCCPKIRSLGLDVERPFPLAKSSERVSDKYLWTYPPPEDIADAFWFLEHLEVNLEIGLADETHFNKIATFEGAKYVWRYVWEQIRRSRIQKSHEITTPRLRSIDVVGGSYRPLFEISQKEAGAQQRFHIRLSERDDEAKSGIAKITCVELEALQTKLGSKVFFRNDHQRMLMDFVVKRANNGPCSEPVPHSLMDREMTRASSWWNQRDEHRFHYR